MWKLIIGFILGLTSYALFGGPNSVVGALIIGALWLWFEIMILTILSSRSSYEPRPDPPDTSEV